MDYCINTNVTAETAAKLFVSNEMDISSSNLGQDAVIVLETLNQFNVNQLLRVVDYAAKISDIKVSNVPQFGNCESVKSIPEILSTVGTCGMNYTQLGYKLKQDVNSTAEANMKYGENHGKAACVLGIARVEGGRFYSTVMGEGFRRVGKEDRDHLLTYLYFKIPIVQNLICKAQKGIVNGYDLMPEMKISTQKRRGQCLRSILKKMYELGDVELQRRIDNILWDIEEGEG